MKTYRLAAKSYLLPYIHVPVFLKVEEGKVTTAWTDESGTFPLQRGERESLENEIRVNHARSRVLCEVNLNSDALPGVSAS